MPLEPLFGIWGLKQATFSGNYEYKVINIADCNGCPLMKVERFWKWF